MTNKLSASSGQASRTIWSKALALLGIAATIMGLLYYSVSLLAPMFGKGHGKQPASVDAFLKLDPHLITNEPWTKGEWEATGHVKAKLRVDLDGDEPVVVVAGLETGNILIRLDAITSEGMTYRGEATCAEHGGRIARHAYLHRLADNRMRLQIDSASEVVSNIDLFFRHARRDR